MASSILRSSMFLGKLPPEALDAIFPHGPVLALAPLTSIRSRSLPRSSC